MPLDQLRLYIENSIKSDFSFTHKVFKEIPKEFEDRYKVFEILDEPHTIIIRSLFPAKTPKIGSILVETRNDGMQIFQYKHELSILEKVRAKTIVVMGGTGTGKTTLLNAYVNY